LTAETRHNVFLAFKEALHNVVKHARASEVRVSLELLPSSFALTIADNGLGFELNGFQDLRSDDASLKISAAAASDRGASTPKPIDEAPASGRDRVAAGNGLLNMRKRLEEIGGAFRLDSAVDEGTRVRLVINVKR